jgi:hypothetical protein
MTWNAMKQWLAGAPLLRRAAEVIFRAVCRRHLARLDAREPGRCQKRILLGLMHLGQQTRFGVEHDFRRVRGLADFRRLVPVRVRADLRRTGSEEQPLPAALSAAWREALATALALVAQARPQAHLLAGHLVLVGEDASSGPDLSRRIPALLRPFALTAPGDELALAALADRASLLPVTCLVGPLEHLTELVERARHFRGRSSVRDVWPGLTAAICTGRPSVAALTHFRNLVGSDVLLLEMVAGPEGPIALEDPRFGSLRLLCDHGLHFELVPVHGESAERLTVDEAELNVPYELVLTSPAGLWACRTGRTVCLERRDFPQVRFLRPAVPLPVLADEEVDATPRPAVPGLLVGPHRRNGDSPAGPPESFVRSPSSILADRG